MSVHAMSWAKRQRTGSATRKLVLLAIADYADDRGIAWPSQMTLAAETEMSDRSIRTALRDLERINLISRRARPVLPNGQRQTDLITLNFEATGKIVRRQKPPENDDRPADTVSGKPSRNYLIQDKALPYQGKELRKQGVKRRPTPAVANGSWMPGPEDEL